MSVTPRQWQQLEAAARQASTQAYCPYSRFAVGAAVLGEDGRVFAGCNVENAAYDCTLCAERGAVAAAVAQGLRRILAVLVYTPTQHPTAPCGACRQVLHEFGPQAAVRCIADGEACIELTLDALLPQAFGPHNLAGQG